MVPTFPVCRSARMGALLCPGSLAVPTPQSFGTATGPEDFSGSGVGGPHVGQPRTASRPRSTRLEPVQRLRSFNRRFLTYTFWPRLPDPHRLAVPARPVVVGAASRPPRRPPGRTAPSFYRTAATARRQWPCTTTRSHRTSWRTHASLEDITLHLQLADPLVLLRRSRSSSARSGSRSRPPGAGSAGWSDDADPLRRHRDTQLCSVPECTPSSSATSGIGLPVSITMRTAPSRNSGVYVRCLDPMNPNFPCNHGLHATRGGTS